MKRNNESTRGKKKILLQNLNAVHLILAALFGPFSPCAGQAWSDTCFLFSLDTNQSNLLSFNIWYCLKARKKERKERRKKALHEKAISKQGNEGLMFSQRKEHIRKIEKKSKLEICMQLFLSINSLLSVVYIYIMTKNKTLCFPQKLSDTHLKRTVLEENIWMLHWIMLNGSWPATKRTFPKKANTHPFKSSPRK